MKERVIVKGSSEGSASDSIRGEGGLRCPRIGSWEQ